MKSLLMATLALSASAHAFEIHPNFALGLDFGGEKFFEASLTDGSKRSFNAGSLAVLTVGADLRHPIGEVPLETRLALGFKAAGAQAENGKYDFFRWILEASEHYRIDAVPLLVGAGVTWHVSNKVVTDGIFESYATDVDPSLGFFVQSDYVFRRDGGENYPLGVSEMHLGARVTIQKYTQKAFNKEINANAFGIHFRTLWL
ncbi:MAG TPA: hypothetical protein VM901_08240 [Bdellovibrionota bacterium]|jgi:hypothetical protein|nr:hypothetical protein [Bdellovibrionota bacterium]